LTILAEGYREAIASGVASNPNCPADLLAWLATHKSATVRRRVAENPATPVEPLLALSRASDTWAFQRTLCRRATLPAIVLDSLADSADAEVRPLIPHQPNCSQATLDRLAKDRDSDVRVGVAQAARTSATTLDRLANDRDSHVRVGVARSAGTSATTLARLAGSRRRLVRDAALGNPSCPDHIRAVAALGRD